MTVLLPSASRRSRFLFDWDARHCIAAADQSLNARSGQAATFARASTKTVIDANGVVASVAHSLPGFQWDTDPVTGLKVPGVLLEGARTNLLVRSQEFDNAAWFKGNVTITANAAIAPDGSLTADKATATTTAGTLLTQPAVVASTAASFSIFAKQGSAATDANSFLIYNSTTSTSLLGFTMNYGTGVITYTLGSSGVTVTAVGNGWWHITMSATSGITSGDTITVYAAFQSGVFTAGMYAYLWGAQLEAAAFASSYIPTVAAAVSRSGDTLTWVYNAVPQVMTMYVRGMVRYVAGALTPIQALVGAGSVPSVAMISDAAYTYSRDETPAGNLDAILGSPPVIGDVLEQIVQVVSSGGVRTTVQQRSINGAAIVTSAASAPAAIDFPAAWSLPILQAGYPANESYMATQSIRIAAGVQSLAYMRAG